MTNSFDQDANGQEPALCRVDDIPPDGAKEFTVSVGGRKRRAFAVRKGVAVYAYLNSCPHTGAPLNWSPDQFFNHDRTLLQCSLHFALFHIEDGYCLYGPCAGARLIAVPLRVEDGVITAEWCDE